MDDLIDLKTIFSAITKHIIIIILCTIIGGLLGYAYYSQTATPQYHSSSDLLVSHKKYSAMNEYNQRQDDLQMISTYREMIRKPIVLQPSLNKLQQNYNYKGNLNKLTSSIKVSRQSSKSQIMTVNATASKPSTAMHLVNTVSNTFVKKVRPTMKVNNVTVLSKGTTVNNPNLPSKSKYIIIGLIIGLVISALFFIFLNIYRFLYNNKFTNEEDLKSHTKLTNLGIIYKNK